VVEVVVVVFLGFRNETNFGFSALGSIWRALTLER
jgi:hypothetical protein